MILSELIPFLQRLDAKPKKHLSQNFLVDPNLVRKIVQMADIAPGDPVLEIGPGPGAWTQALLEQGAHVYAVEMDPLFARELSRLKGNLTVFPCDFLQFPMETLPPRIKVVANLPYHITTPILEKLFASSFHSLTVMVQKEVADRMKAPPGSKEFGSLSLFVRFHAKITGSLSVPASCIYPRPKVASTVIRLEATERPLIDSTPLFSLIHKAFQQRRKMLTSSLPFPKERLRKVLSDLGIRIDARPEVLSLEQWMQLIEKLPPETEKPGSLHLFQSQ